MTERLPKIFLWILGVLLLLLIALVVVQQQWTPVIIQIDKENFAGGVLDIGSARFDEPGGTGRTFHVVFIDSDTEAKLSCPDNADHVDRDGYFTPGLQSYVVLKLSNCEIAEFKYVFLLGVF